MIVQVLSTGSELLMGDVVDSNAAFICRRFWEIGIRVHRTTIVSDRMDDISQVLKSISQQADVCIVTGGLGPTKDDLTAAACADAAADKLVLHDAALDSMRPFFERKGYELTPENEKQAILPAGAGILENRHGTAPGFYLKIGTCLFFFLPGVPSEMKQMLGTQVVKMIESTFSLSAPVPLMRLTVFGLGESKTGALLSDFEELFPNLVVGFRAVFPLIEVKLSLRQKADLKNEAKQELEKAGNIACKRFGRHLVSDKGVSMAEEVGRLLVKQKKTLAIAESCTGGLIANWMTDVAGSSDYFLFSGVTYSNDAKMNILGVDQKIIIDNGAVHENTAAQMAAGARLKSGADIGVSTTGIAGPTGGSKEKPVGMVCIGLSTQKQTDARTYVFRFDDRLMNKQMFAATALNRVRTSLLG